MRNKTLHQICRMIASGEIPKEVYNKYLGDTPIGFMTPLEIMAHLNSSQWIPVSERLPDGKDDTYLVTRTDGKYTWVEEGDFVIDEFIFIGDEYRFNTKRKIKDVAWMPLPEPYKENNK